jgi:hypothetical protein
MLRIGETPVERDVENKLEVQIDHIERREVDESVERLLALSFAVFDKRDDSVYECFIQSPVRLPKHERQIFAE